MPRLDRLLARELRRAKRDHKLAPDQAQAARKVLADDLHVEQFATECVVGMDGCIAAHTAALTAKSDRPVRDWIRANWTKILMALVAFALSLI